MLAQDHDTTGIQNPLSIRYSYSQMINLHHHNRMPLLLGLKNIPNAIYFPVNCIVLNINLFSGFVSSLSILTKINVS